MAQDDGTGDRPGAGSDVQLHRVCGPEQSEGLHQNHVECLFFFKDTGVQPHLSVGLTSVRQKGGLPGPRPRNPLLRHGHGSTVQYDSAK